MPLLRFCIYLPVLVLTNPNVCRLLWHAIDGGCIAVFNGKVTIKESTFEGFRASRYGGALYVEKTSTPMMIESTTFKNNEADVRFIR